MAPALFITYSRFIGDLEVAMNTGGRNFLIVFVFFGGCTYRDLAWRVLRICDRFENFNQSFR